MGFYVVLAFVVALFADRKTTLLLVLRWIKVGQQDRDNISSLLWFLWLVMGKRTQRGFGEQRRFRNRLWLNLAIPKHMHWVVLCRANQPTNRERSCWSGNVSDGNSVVVFVVVGGGFPFVVGGNNGRREIPYSMETELEIGSSMESLIRVGYFSVLFGWRN